MAQLVERSLPNPEVRGSNPVIGKIYWTFIYCQLYWKDENKEKRGREWPIFKKQMFECKTQASRLWLPTFYKKWAIPGLYLQCRTGKKLLQANILVPSAPTILWPGFNSLHTIYAFFQFTMLKLMLEWEKDENKTLRGRDMPILQNLSFLLAAWSIIVLIGKVH